ncbi:MAG: hypothetical protein V2B18_16580 [Pseudomonadota bacterium]
MVLPSESSGRNGILVVVGKDRFAQIAAVQEVFRRSKKVSFGHEVTGRGSVIHIPDHKLLEAVDSMSFDHGGTVNSVGEKSDAKAGGEIKRPCCNTT